MQALNKQALRILRLFGNQTAVRVYPTVGTEQEYFLIDKALYLQRPDLIVTGRTLYGAKPPKGQELDDHFFGAIKPRVHAFMRELDEELWKLGVLVKTEHNEVAPSQHELAPIFSTVNIAADHNQLTMEIMKKVADRHGMVCLLHEKPFGGVNGSGKHNNYSLSTDTGVNLLEPGETPSENAQFLLFLSAIHGGGGRLSGSASGHGGLARATITVWALTRPRRPLFPSSWAMNSMRSSSPSSTPPSMRATSGIRCGWACTSCLSFPKDSTDRNRTSPFAFTGNKFEFRIAGQQSERVRPQRGAEHHYCRHPDAHGR